MRVCLFNHGVRQKNYLDEKATSLRINCHSKLKEAKRKVIRQARLPSAAEMLSKVLRKDFCFEDPKQTPVWNVNVQSPTFQQHFPSWNFNKNWEPERKCSSDLTGTWVGKHLRNVEILREMSLTFGSGVYWRAFKDEAFEEIPRTRFKPWKEDAH